MQFWALIACLPDMLEEEYSRLRLLNPLGSGAEGSWTWCRREFYRMLLDFHHLTLLEVLVRRPTYDG
jgi:hypothetical protein